MIKELDHVQLTIPYHSESEAREYYCGVLELKEIEKPNALKINGGFWLTLGTLQLHIGVEEHLNRRSTKAHIAFRVDDLSYWRQKLTKAGYLIIESKIIPGFDRFNTRDPFGNRLEFLCECSDDPRL